MERLLRKMHQSILFEILVSFFVLVLRNHVNNYFFSSYSEMENQGTLDPGNDVDIYCLHLTFSR